MWNPMKLDNDKVHEIFLGSCQQLTKVSRRDQHEWRKHLVVDASNKTRQEVWSYCYWQEVTVNIHHLAAPTAAAVHIYCRIQSKLQKHESIQFGYDPTWLLMPSFSSYSSSCRKMISHGCAHLLQTCSQNCENTSSCNLTTSTTFTIMHVPSIYNVIS